MKSLLLLIVLSVAGCMHLYTNRVLCTESGKVVFDKIVLMDKWSGMDDNLYDPKTGQHINIPLKKAQGWECESLPVPVKE